MTASVAGPQRDESVRLAPVRVTAIDGLRGVAAMLVVLYHLEGAISRSATDWLWSPVRAIVQHGYLGVDVFFVISGFVIALSVNRARPTLGYLGRFALRRSVRLDPPYWTAIALELCLLAATQVVIPERQVAWPSATTLLAHLLYLQELLGYGSVITIFWTLCYEIQFYLFYVALQVLRANLPSALRAPLIATTAAAGLFALSLWTRYAPPEGLPYGLAINRWFQFYLGVLTWRAVTDRASLPGLVAGWAAVAATIAWTGAPANQAVAIGVSVVVILGVKYAMVGRVLRARPLLWLGSISYSVYLLHSSVGWRVVGLLQRMWPGTWDGPVAVAVFVITTGLCVLVAWLAWWAVERPFLKLATRISLTPGGPVLVSERLEQSAR